MHFCNNNKNSTDIRSSHAYYLMVKIVSFFFFLYGQAYQKLLDGDDETYKKALSNFEDALKATSGELADLLNNPEKVEEARKLLLEDPVRITTSCLYTEIGSFITSRSRRRTVCLNV